MPVYNVPQHSTADVRRSEGQGVLILSAVPAGDEAKLGKSLLDVGALAIEGRYSCDIDTHDWSGFDVVLKPSANTGSITATLRRMYMNRQMIRDDADTGTLTAGNVSVLSTTTITGTQRFRLDIDVPSSGSVTFTPGSDPTALDALAEFNGA